MVSQKFSKYDGMQMVTDDSKYLKAEFRHWPPAVSGDHWGRSSELAQFVLCDLVWYWSEISSEGLPAGLIRHSPKGIITNDWTLSSKMRA